MLKTLFRRFSPRVAVDLGTANTQIGAPGQGLILNEPSVVAIALGSHKVLGKGCAVGGLARQMLGRAPTSISVVAPLHAGVVTDFHLCEAMLRYFLTKTLALSAWRKPTLLVAFPGCVTQVEKRALFHAAQRAGAREVLALSQAMAAALGSGLPIFEPVASMVCDIGGGTTEVAIFSLGDVIASQSVRIGGNQMDEAIVEYVRRRYSLRIAPSAAEQLRIEIGSAAPLDTEQVAELRGMDTISGLPRRALITSEEVREALQDSLLRIVDAIRATLDQCGPELAADLVDHGIVFSGGCSLLRKLDQFLTEQTGIPVRVAEDPECVVARGMINCLENFPRWRNRLESSDDDV